MIGPETMLREVKVEDAVGMVLAHDLTQIIPGKIKGRLFKKGHVIRREDIPALLSIGKEHIYTMQLSGGYIHEDEAAERMAAAVSGEHITLSEPHEGKVTLKSAIHGLAKIDKAFVDAVNALEQIVLSTVKNNTVVKPGQPLVGTRVIPLIIDGRQVAQVEQLAGQFVQARQAHPIEVKPFRRLRVGLVTTGSEVYKGLIQDKFGPVVREKVAALGSEVIEQKLVPDQSEAIVEQIRYFLQEQQADLILITGGMSVDPDDRTPGAIQRAGARIVSYGTPMLPGSMLLMGYLDRPGNGKGGPHGKGGRLNAGEEQAGSSALSEHDNEGAAIPIMGLPGCVMHDPFTSFDVLLPRICAGETIERQDIVELGYGGLYG